MLEDAYRKSQEHKDQIRSDMQTGRARAEAANRDGASADSEENAYAGTAAGQHRGGPTYTESNSSTYRDDAGRYAPPSAGTTQTDPFDEPGEPPTRHM